MLLAAEEVADFAPDEVGGDDTETEGDSARLDREVGSCRYRDTRKDGQGNDDVFAHC